jgi:hypothetical protein
MKYVWVCIDRDTPDLIFYFTSRKKALAWVESQNKVSECRYLIDKENVN